MLGSAGFGKILIMVGAVALVLGLFLAFAGRIPVLGGLPGDTWIGKHGISSYS